MYISDYEVQGRGARAPRPASPVRVLLASPGWIDENTATAADLAAAGMRGEFLGKYELHAKLVIADRWPSSVSENLCWNSLENNREIGVFVTEPEPFAGIADTFESDWAAGVIP